MSESVALDYETHPAAEPLALPPRRQSRAPRRLIAAIHEMALSRSQDAVQAVALRAARALTAADGADFILRDGDQAFHAEEDSIAPLFKGRRFSFGASIGGWTIANRRHAVVADVNADARVAPELFRQTFVKALAVVPIGAEAPLGAIGVYWASPHLASPDEIEALHAIADTAWAAMENIRLYRELEECASQRERQLAEATRRLDGAKRWLEGFSHAVSLDLRAPLRAIDGATRTLLDQYDGALPPAAQAQLDRIFTASRQAGALVDRLSSFDHVANYQIQREPTDLSAIAREIADELRRAFPARRAEFHIEDGVVADGDAPLLRVVMENLLGNAWKFTSRREVAEIAFGRASFASGPAYFVRDNGAGFDRRGIGPLFQPFARLHDAADFPGLGIGLAIARHILKKHGGEIWAESTVDRGAAFYFTL
jgi:signal transduction histidine kinase